MAWRLFGAKLLSEPILTYHHSDPKEQWNCIVNWKVFIKENEIESVICEMAAISYQAQFADRAVYPTNYRQVSNIRRTLVGNKIVDHSDVVGASPVGAAPTTSSFST